MILQVLEFLGSNKGVMVPFGFLVLFHLIFLECNLQTLRSNLLNSDNFGKVTL